jgi:hypothetical protein
MQARARPKKKKKTQNYHLSLFSGLEGLKNSLHLRVSLPSFPQQMKNSLQLASVSGGARFIAAKILDGSKKRSI